MKAVNAAPGVGPVNQLISTLRRERQRRTSRRRRRTRHVPQGATTVNFEASATPGATHRIHARDHRRPPPTSRRSSPASRVRSRRTCCTTRTSRRSPAAGSPALRERVVELESRQRRRCNGTQLASNVAFPNASPYVTTAAGDGDASRSPTPRRARCVATQDNVMLTANQTSSVYLIGPAGRAGHPGHAGQLARSALSTHARSCGAGIAPDTRACSAPSRNSDHRRNAADAVGRGRRGDASVSTFTKCTRGRAAPLPRTRAPSSGTARTTRPRSRRPPATRCLLRGARGRRPRSPPAPRATAARGSDRTSATSPRRSSGTRLRVRQWGQAICMASDCARAGGRLGLRRPGLRVIA